MSVEPNLVARLWDFAGALWPHWWAWVTGGVLLIEQLAELFVPSQEWLETIWPKAKRRKPILLAASAMLFIACFLAFDDVNIKNQRLALDVGRLEGERDEARRERDANVRPEQQQTIEQLSRDLVEARAKIDGQKSQIDKQQAEINKITTPRAVRHLSDEQRAALKERFANLTDEIKSISFGVPLGDGNSFEYANDFVETFKQIGFHVEAINLMLPASAQIAQHEITILINDAANVPRSAALFAEAISRAGFDVGWGKRGGPNAREFEVLVGPAR